MRTPDNEPLTKREIVAAIVLAAWIPLFLIALGEICGGAFGWPAFVPAVEENENLNRKENT